MRTDFGSTAGSQRLRPAAIDPQPEAGLLDEVTIIVYAPIEICNRFREISLSRWNYTRSRDTVFDMPNSALRIHSPAPLDEPATAPGLLPEGARILRDLRAMPAPVVGDCKKGVTITGPSASTFLSRLLEFFDDQEARAAGTNGSPGGRDAQASQ